ncbi:TetR/AcrR family transcriptional regulator [Oribacterium sp. oral taxon 108]|uniref:TetR/AcrR family transcriptional regulator n=1 Tax=Oribacterium sp. oral taxon 108 TaxID=712414 RepID=UPI00020DD1A5|nr:TetR/AcrR family transcriptional regulator [Oribacterium sp. oral taxon 108]EGL38151.1 transcriptional regulator, TetR family [Oribacterium sp. oral taxon 108 str. F0425]
MAKTKEERRNEIIETAGKLFEEKGYEQTQVQDIVNEIGVAKGLFYYYFKSKDEVMEELADRYADAIIDAVNKLIDKDITTFNKINRIFQIFIDSAEKKFGIFMGILNVKNGITHERIFFNVGKKMVPLVTELILSGNDNGECNCSDPKFITEFLVSGLFNIMNQISPDEKIDYLKEKLPTIKTMILKLYNFADQKESN